MIQNIKDYGYTSGNLKEPIGYAVEIEWSKEDDKGTEIFKGYDIQKVIGDAFSFMVNHYKNITNGQ
jgi:hypothetical protein